MIRTVDFLPDTFHTKTMKKYLTLISFIILCELVGIAATPFTIEAISTWYIYLNKPFFSPPNWVFGPVWTILYCLMGVAAYLVWTSKKKRSTVNRAFTIFVIQLACNFFWSILFFALHAPLLAFIDIVVLLALIAVNIQIFYAVHKHAGYLLVPYFAWVIFATLLNLSIVLLNMN